MMTSHVQKTSTVNAATAATATAATVTPAPAHWDAAPVADFHQERAGVLQPMPRRAAPLNPAPVRRTAAGPRAGAKALDDAAVQALDAVRHGGAAGLESWLENSSMDPLERDTLLRRAQHDANGAIKATLQQARDRLMRENGAAIAQGREQQSLLQATLHALVQPGDGAPGDGPGQLAQLADRLLGTRSGAPIDAHSFGKVLAEACCAGEFCTMLAALRRQRARAPQSRLANSGPQVWLSLKDAASLHLLQSCHAIGASLHDRLTNAGLLEPGPGPDGGVRAGLGLLALANHAAADAAALVAAVGASTDARRQGAVYRQLAWAVRELPLTLWPQPKARYDLLASLDDTGSAVQRNGADLRNEQHLRTAHRLKTTTMTTTIEEQ
jgi:hypothetical protein